MPQAFSREDIKNIIRGLAATLMLIGVAVVSPLVGVLSTLFVPLPVLYYRARLGRNKGLIIPLGTLAIMMLIFGRVSVDLLLLSELLLGFMLGEFLEANVGLEKTIVGACVTVLAAGAIGLLILAGMAGTSIYGLVSGYATNTLELNLVFWEKMGMSPEFIQMVSDSKERIRDAFISVTPGLLAMAFIFLSWISLLMARSLFRRAGLFFPDYGPLVRWKAPEILVWGVVICGAMLLLPASSLKIIGLNGLMVFLTIFFFEGIAVVAFFFEKKKFPGIVRVFLYSLIVLQQLVLLLVVGLGLFDVWLNFRKLETDNSK